MKWLSRKTGLRLRLLSEAEWEYACRAGSETELISRLEAHLLSDGPDAHTAQVGSFPANNFGLYDMQGNVWEWCEDWWNPNYLGKPDILKETGGAWKTGNAAYRIVRGRTPNAANRGRRRVDSGAVSRRLSRCPGSGSLSGLKQLRKGAAFLLLRCSGLMVRQARHEGEPLKATRQNRATSP